VTRKIAREGERERERERTEARGKDVGRCVFEDRRGTEINCEGVAGMAEGGGRTKGRTEY